MKENELDNSINTLVEILELKKDKNGFYKTLWGKKSIVGIKETIKKILKIEVD